MSRNIKFLSLQKSELSYEVAIRGTKPADTVQDLRRQIVALSLSMPSLDILESGLDVSDDIKGVRDSLMKVQSNLIMLRSKFDPNVFDRTDNLLLHIDYRLRRITPDCEDTEEAFRVCTNSMHELRRELQMLNPKRYGDSAEIDTGPATSGAVQSAQTPSSIRVTCDRGASSDLSKLKFNGKTCVRAFIQRVNEFISARNIESSKILSYATEIFEGDALHWYRAIRDSIGTWNELSVHLRNDFSQHDYDYRLLNEIRSRTQGASESITIYLSIMQGMFSRLTKVVSDEDKLEILLHNIRPCYASVLAMATESITIDSLRTMCRNYEAVQARLSHFSEPPKATADTLAPEFSYRGSSNTNTNKQPNQGSSGRSSDKHQVSALSTQPKPKPKPKSKPMCLRCRDTSHILKDCRADRTLVCFKCGLKGYTSRNCPKCNKESKDPKGAELSGDSTSANPISKN